MEGDERRVSCASAASGFGDAPRLILASASPRRQAMLAEAGVRAECVPADVDDADLDPGSASPEAWAMAMAWFKAARVRWLLRRREGSLRPGAATVDGRSRATPGATGERWILAADTVCDIDGRIVGKPVDGHDAERTLRFFSGRAHRVLTGYCVLAVDDGVPRTSTARAPARERLIALDCAVVHLGALDESQIAQHVASGAWRGKAGGYNFSDQLAAGWPLRCAGDEATVTGLPMKRLMPLLERFRASNGVDGRVLASEVARCV